ncbi:hypothetical protein VTK73DRAFT_6869 [Phialemonium thermophilum]|uniref:Alpha/beta hydrolase fold-3 domain-containing protein n=1 Tax=Phialemonium thermophilum TaxID=223376 RepID=A0ABR3XVW8_9PEZI
MDGRPISDPRKDVGPPMHRVISAPMISRLAEDVADEACDDYVNPHDSSSRWYLVARTFALRQAASLGLGLQHRAAPGAPSTTKTIWLDSTIGGSQGEKIIKVDVWIPRSRPQKVPHKRPAVINFHGGGFVLGQGTDDARWAGALMDGLGAVVFAVNYRLAPAYPFPKPVEDCADAILQIAARADEFNIDRSRILISGFSAGGNLALASWVLLEEPERWNYHIKFPKPAIAGICLFYPLLDWTITRPRKRARCLRPDMTLPSSLTDLFDASYIYPPLPPELRTDCRLSPGLMPDEMLHRLPPMHLCVCEWDMLLPEALTFAERLNSAHKSVIVRIVAKEKHAWDKPPPIQPKESMAIEYAAAIETLRHCLKHAEENNDQTAHFSKLIRANTGT